MFLVILKRKNVDIYYMYFKDTNIKRCVQYSPQLTYTVQSR